MSSRRRHRVAVLALDGVYPFDVGIPARILGAAQDRYEIAVCSVDGRPVETNAGFSLAPQSGPEIIESADTTIVAPVDPTRLTRDVPEAVAAALARRSPGTRIASLCTGGFVLAAAGILKGRPATAHWECAPLFRRWYPDIALDEPLALAQLARHAHMSPRTFGRRLREETGLTPHRWLTGQRLERARRLLESSTMTIDRIAAEIGFATAASLRQLMSAELGTSPQAYRRAFQADGAVV